MTSEVTHPRSLRNSILRIGLIVVICLVAASAIYVRNLLKSRATPPPPLPVPNAYDSFVRAGKLVKGVVPNDGKLREARPEELRAWIDLNCDATRIARANLGKPSQVPLIYSADLTEVYDRMSACRLLARVIAAEGELALQENRQTDAAHAFLEVAQLGPAIGRGGLWIDVLVGVAVERTGLDGLRRVRQVWEPNDLRKTIAILREIDKTRSTFDEVRNNEEYWTEQSIGLWTRLQFKVLDLGAKLSAPVTKAGGQALQAARTTLRADLLALENALDEMTHKGTPEKSPSLGTGALPKIPKGSTTSDPMP